MVTEVLDPYNLEELQPQLEGFGYQFHYIPRTASTMILAENYIRAGNEQPAGFLTDHQTQGRGREGRVWLDKEGASILVTAVLEIKDSNIPIFADLVALHTASILRSVPLIDDVCVKYPNDLVIGDQKVGGILAENLYDDSRKYLGTSIGIGINVHYNEAELAGYPADYSVTALDLHTTVPNSRQALLVAIFGGVKFLPADAEVFQTNYQAHEAQNNLWRAYSSLLGRVVQVEDDREILLRGRVADIQIGRGIFLEGVFRSRWFNQFDTNMKVRLA